MKTPPKRDLIGEVSPPVPTPAPPPKRRSKTLAQGRKPGSGRPVGSKDQVNEELRQAIYRTYEALGAEKFLLKFAREFPESFVGKVLVKILPATPKEAEVEITSNTLNVSQLSDMETARRIAFLLNKPLYEAGVLPDMSERKPPAREKIIEPYVPEGQCSEAELCEMARKQGRDIVADTREQTIETYHGSASEQGLGRRRKRSLY